MLRADLCTPKTHVEVLTSSTPECDCIGDTAFKDITKLKWGGLVLPHWGPYKKRR